MASDANLAEVGRVLADALDAVLAEWVVRCVERRMWDYTGRAAEPDMVAAAERAGEQARAEVIPAVRALLERDVDEQAVNPLALVRAAVRYATEVLRAAGVPPVVRDEFEERA